MTPDQIHFFRRALIEWYTAHARDLPWRRTRDPYLIWISEIMLQQTRVAAVLDHYARFTARFPTVQTLAAAEEPEVLALWSGLGYYRRARMMHRAAKVVVAEHSGIFPAAAADLLLLPGIGAYTAAAVASIAFAEPVAAVDGNVERVLTRVAALPEARKNQRAIQELAARLLHPAQPSAFNQAMMELGATICLPRGPLCLQCPVQSVCLTRGEHPVVPRKPLTAKDAFFGLVEKDGQVLLEQRPADASQMAGMWQLPELEAAPAAGTLVCRVKHSITVTNYTVRVFAQADNYRHPWRRDWVRREETGTLPLTGLARKILRKLDPGRL